MIICLGTAMSVAAQSVSRERELGTFEQLMVSPLRTHEILIGKMVPPILAGLFNGTLYIVAAVLFFGVPFTGSLFAFYLTLFVYLLTLTGLGMLVSTLSATQQQAFLGVFLVTVPAILLSGYASPVENMPSWLQTISLANPCRHYLVLVEGLFLKALPFADIWASTWPLLIIATVTIGGAAYLFRANKE
jgi:ABC-2 type transport system permease protein